MKPLSLIEFCKGVFEVVHIPKGDEIYLLAGLITLFHQISQSLTIEWDQFTNYIVEKIVETDHVALNEIQNKFISLKTQQNKPLFNSA
jgi:hypothetical protein